MRSHTVHISSTTAPSALSRFARWLFRPSGGLWLLWVAMTGISVTAGPAAFLGWICATAMISGGTFMAVAYLIPPPPRLSERHALIAHLKAFARGTWGAAVLAIGAVIGAMVGIDSQQGAHWAGDRWVEILGEYLGVVVGVAALGAWIWAMCNCAVDLLRTPRMAKVHHIRSALEKLGPAPGSPGVDHSESRLARWLADFAVSMTCSTSRTVSTALISGFAFPIATVVAFSYLPALVMP